MSNNNNINNVIADLNSSDDSVKNNIIAELLSIINNQKQNIDTGMNSVFHSQTTVGFMNYLMSFSSSISCLVVGCIIGYIICKNY